MTSLAVQKRRRRGQTRRQRKAEAERRMRWPLGTLAPFRIGGRRVWFGRAVTLLEQPCATWIVESLEQP